MNFDELESQCKDLIESGLFSTKGQEKLYAKAREKPDDEKVLKKWKDAMDDKMDRYQEVIELRQKMGEAIAKYHAKISAKTFPEQLVAKRLHRSKISIETKVAKLPIITYKNRTGMAKILEQIVSFLDNVQAYYQKNATEPLPLKGVKLKKSLETWDHTLKTSIDGSKSSPLVSQIQSQLESAKKALEEKQEFDAGQLVKNIKQLTAPKASSTHKGKKDPKKPKVKKEPQGKRKRSKEPAHPTCIDCEMESSKIIYDTQRCIECYKNHAQQRMRVIQAKESNFDFSAENPDAAEYEEKSEKLYAKLDKLNSSRSNIVKTANSFEAYLKACELLLKDVEYDEAEVPEMDIAEEEDEAVDEMDISSQSQYSSEEEDLEGEDEDSSFQLENDASNFEAEVLRYISDPEISPEDRDSILNYYRQKDADSIRKIITMAPPKKQRRKTYNVFLVKKEDPNSRLPMKGGEGFATLEQAEKFAKEYFSDEGAIMSNSYSYKITN